ncbi:MAG: Terminase-like family protein [Ruminococcaceae bacterium]|nr:Terminase-like family protein [Oscillospiraceae bacterium]
MSEIIWKPQAKQLEFMKRKEYECLYGGAAGGGKSDALLIEALRQVEIPNYRAIIFRRTYPQLEALISRSLELYPKAFPKAKYNSSEKRWLFESGAKIFFGYMQHEQDKYNYQGKPYDFIAFDELTHFTYSQYMYLMSRNRPTGPNTRVYIRATANPGGIGHAWVKERFITPAPPLTPIETTYNIQTPDKKIIQIKKERVFVPATVFDNKALLENDPEYLATLSSLPEAEKNALLLGSWDGFDGQVFSEWQNDSAHYEDGKWSHVIEPFEIPYNWKILRVFDFGYSRPFAVLWLAFNEEGKCYVIKEYYGFNGTANQGIRLEPSAIAQNIREIEDTSPELKGRDISGVADPSIWDKSRGESIARVMEKHPYYIHFKPGKNDRLSGLMQFHYRMHFDENGECLFQVFNTCKQTIRTLPALVYDEKKVEDINTEGEDHIYDAIRYGLMEYTVAPRKPKAIKDCRNDPLNLVQG